MSYRFITRCIYSRSVLYRLIIITLHRIIIIFWKMRIKMKMNCTRIFRARNSYDSHKSSRNDRGKCKRLKVQRKRIAMRGRCDISAKLSASAYQKNVMIMRLTRENMELRVISKDFHKRNKSAQQGSSKENANKLRGWNIKQTQVICLLLWHFPRIFPQTRVSDSY